MYNLVDHPVACLERLGLEGGQALVVGPGLVPLVVEVLDSLKVDERVDGLGCYSELSYFKQRDLAASIYCVSNFFDHLGILGQSGETIEKGKVDTVSSFNCAGASLQLSTVEFW